jgi:multiple sugar transport system substrate-binding protein
MKHRAKRTALALTSAAVLSALVLSGCTSSDSDGGASGPITDEQREKALSTPTTLTFWTWVPDIEDEVALFEKKYPAIDVEVVNVGQGPDHYQKLRTAIEAGEGAPDVAQVEYQMIPSFRVNDSLLDLTPYGGADLEADYVPWVWGQVSTDDGVWAIPQDTGPLGNLYRDDILTAAGVTEAPVTWDDYRAAAEKVRATGSYISNLSPSEPAFVVGLLWQAGLQPFGYDGEETVTVDLVNDDSKKVVEYLQRLIQDDLVSVDPGWTDQWYQAIAGGKYAGWLTAAWGPIFLQGTAADTSGLWRAAPLPQWSAGDAASGNWGGSSDVVLKSSKNPIAAYELAKFINNDPTSTMQFATQQFLFPAANSVLESDEFLSQEAEFYGGQQVNKLFAEVSTTVNTEFQWLPYNDYAFSQFNETLGKAMAEKGDLVAGLQAWQDALIKYGQDQGFTVNP